MDEKSTSGFSGLSRNRRLHAVLLAIAVGACGAGGSGKNTGNDTDAGSPGSDDNQSDAGDSPGTNDGGSTPHDGSFNLIDGGIQCSSDAGPSTTIRVGGDCAATIEADYHGAEFDEPIVLSVGDVPAGVIAEIVNVKPEGLVPGTGSSLYLHIRGIAPAGPLKVTVTGTTASHGTSTVTYSITITSQPGFKLATVAAGKDVNCGADSDGKAYCWGDNAQGELGIGTSGRMDQDYGRMKPVALDTAVRFSKLAPGPYSSCGLDLEGHAYCWGVGYLGNGSAATDPVPTPTAVEGNLSFTDLVNNSLVSCGLTSAGAVYCWNGGNGFLGNGTLDTAMVPLDVSGGRTYKDIAVGDESVCALTTDGKPYCWGNNTYGELGNGNTDNQLSPVPVNTTLTFDSIAMGLAASCGLTAEGKAYCWGKNTYYTLGIGMTDTDEHFSPVAVAGNLTFTSLAGGGGGFCGLDAKGHAYCWSSAGVETDESDGELPTALRGGVTFSQISVGDKMNCGIATNGLKATYCWSNRSTNGFGYLGTGDKESYAGPVAIASP